MLIATELGVAEDLGTILQSMEEHLDEFEDHLCEKTGKVYISRKNFEFIKLCSGKMPFTFNELRVNTMLWWYQVYVRRFYRWYSSFS